MNKVQLMGRLVRDPELKELTSGKKVANFTLAVDYAKDKDGNKLTNFIPCMAWERRGEVITQYFGKGQRMLVTDGMMMVRNYTDANTQEKKTYTYVRVDDFEFVETKGTVQVAATRVSDSVAAVGATKGTGTMAAVGAGSAASGPVPMTAQPSFFDEFGAVEVPF